MVKCLNRKNSWKLFENTLGEAILSYDLEKYFKTNSTRMWKPTIDNKCYRKSLEEL